MIENGKLWMFVVYDHPRDFPDEFVVRRWCIVGPDPIAELELYARGPTLESVRAQLPPGEYRQPARIGDDPSIVETWF